MDAHALDLSRVLAERLIRAAAQSSPAERATTIAVQQP